jgi:hypothetical protein
VFKAGNRIVGRVVHAHEVPGAKRKVYIIPFQHPEFKNGRADSPDFVARNQADVQFILGRLNERGVPTIIAELGEHHAPNGEEIEMPRNIAELPPEARRIEAEGMREAVRRGDYESVLSQFRRNPEFTAYLTWEGLRPGDFHTTSIDEGTEIREEKKAMTQAREVLRPHLLAGKGVPPDVMKRAAQLYQRVYDIRQLRSLRGVERAVDLPERLKAKGTVRNEDSVVVMGSAHAPAMLEHSRKLAEKSGTSFYFIVPESRGRKLDWDAVYPKVHEDSLEVRDPKTKRLMEIKKVTVPLKRPSERELEQLRLEMDRLRGRK